MKIRANIQRAARGFARVAERMDQELVIEAKSEHQPRARLFLVGCWLLVMYLLLGGCSAAQRDHVMPAAGEAAASWWEAASPWLEIGSGVLGVVTCWGALVAWLRRRRDPRKMEQPFAKREERQSGKQCRTPWGLLNVKGFFGDWIRSGYSIVSPGSEPRIRLWIDGGYSYFQDQPGTAPFLGLLPTNTRKALWHEWKREKKRRAKRSKRISRSATAAARGLPRSIHDGGIPQPYPSPLYPPGKSPSYPSGSGCSGNVPPPDQPTPNQQITPTDWSRYEEPPGNDGPEPARVPRIGDPHPVTLSTPGGLTAQDLERLKARMDGAYQPQISLDTWRSRPGVDESVVLTMAKWKELQPPLPPSSGSPLVIANFLRNYPPPNPPPGTGSLDLAHEQYLALMDAIPRHGLSDEEVCTRCQNIGDAFDAAGWDVRALVASLPPRFLEPPTGNRGTQ